MQTHSTFISEKPHFHPEVIQKRVRPEDQEAWVLFSVEAPISLELACRRLPEADSSLLIPVARVIHFTFGFENKISALKLDAKYPVGNPIYPDRTILWLALNWALRQEEIPVHLFSEAPFSELEKAYKKTIWPKIDQLFDEIALPLQEWIHTRFSCYVSLERLQEFLQPFLKWEKTLDVVLSHLVSYQYELRWEELIWEIALRQVLRKVFQDPNWVSTQHVQNYRNMIVLYINIYSESKILYQADVSGGFLEPMSMWEYHTGSDQAVDFAIGLSVLLPIQKEILNSTVELIPLTDRARSHAQKITISLNPYLVKACSKNRKLTACQVLI